MLFLGDIHGSFSHILYSLSRMKEKNKNIVQVGDFGIGFHNEEIDLKNLKIMQEALAIWNCNLYVVRGNHDNPKYFTGEFKDKLNKKFKNIHFIEDYEVVEIEGKHVLFIGGGVSIDRVYRTEGKDYWKDEEVVYSPDKIKKILENNSSIDILVTHSAPMWCYPQGIDAPIVKNYISIDKGDLKTDLEDERDILGKYFDELNDKFKFKYHFYGHFHRNNRQKIADCDHILIGIGDFIDLDKLEKLKQDEPDKFS